MADAINILADIINDILTKNHNILARTAHAGNQFHGLVLGVDRVRDAENSSSDRRFRLEAAPTAYASHRGHVDSVGRSPGRSRPPLCRTLTRRPAMHKFAAVSTAAALLALTGCTATATVAPTGAGAGEVMTNRVIESPTSVYIAPDLASLSQKIPVTGYACSAWSYPTSIGPGLVETIRLANTAALKHEIPGGTPHGPAQGADYNISFDLESVDGRVTFAPSVFSAVISANAEVALQVHVASQEKGEVVRTVLDGEGAATLDGGCPDGARALSEAMNKALKRISENYVDRVINSGAFH
jgi:hypothetical protein